MRIRYKRSFGGRDQYWSCELKKDRTNDCVVRALAHATDTDYLVVWILDSYQMNQDATRDGCRTVDG